MGESSDPGSQKREHVPGGWHSGFNRVYEWGYFAHLIPAVRAVYKILEWKADYQNGFTIAGLGYGFLAKYSGVGIVSVRRAIKTLTALNLIEIVRDHRYFPGGDQPNTPKEYRLKVPAIPYWERLDEMGDAAREEIKAWILNCDMGVWSGKTTPYRRPGSHPVVSRGKTVGSPQSAPSALPSSVALVQEDHIDKRELKKNRQQEAADALRDRGIQNPNLGRLVDQYDPERILEHAMDFDVRRQSGEVIEPGWLIRAIEGGYEPRTATKNKMTAKRVTQERIVAAETKDRQAGERERELCEKFAALSDQEVADLHKQAIEKYGWLARGLENVDPRTHPTMSEFIKGIMTGVMR